MRRMLLWVLSCLFLFSFSLLGANVVRFEGIGGAYSALADGPDAMFFNPAGLGHVHTATLNYSPFYLAYLSYPVSFYGTLGAGWDFEKFNYHEFTLCYAKSFGRFGVGIAPSASITDSIPFSPALDAGFTLDISDVFYPEEHKLDDLVTLGFSVQSLLDTFEVTSLRGGIGVRLFNERLNLASDVAYPISNISQFYNPPPGWCGGVEYWPRRSVAVRGGLNNEYFRVGMGLNSGYHFKNAKVEFDYAFGTSWDALDIILEGSFNLRFDFPTLGGISCKSHPQVLEAAEYASISVFGVERFPDIQWWSFEIIDPRGRVIFEQSREVVDRDLDALPSEIRWSSVWNISVGRYNYRLSIIDKFGDKALFEGFLFQMEP